MERSRPGMARLARMALALGLSPFLWLGAGLPQGVAAEPLTIVAPGVEGSGFDQFSRAVSAALFGSGSAAEIAVLNHPGAGGTVGLTEFVRVGRIAPGSERLLSISIGLTAAIVTQRSPVTLDRVTPIARLANEYLVVAVAVESPLETMQDLLAALRKDPAKVSWAGGTNGSVEHVAVALLLRSLGHDPASALIFVPFLSAGERVSAMQAGTVKVTMLAYGEVEHDIAEGRLRALAVTAPHRLPGIDAPTIQESGADFAFALWRGIAAPADLPEAEQKALIRLIGGMADSPAWQETLKQRGWDDSYLPAEAFGAFLRAEQERLSSTLKRLGFGRKDGEPAPE